MKTYISVCIWILKYIIQHDEEQKFLTKSSNVTVSNTLFTEESLDGEFDVESFVEDVSNFISISQNYN